MTIPRTAPTPGPTVSRRRSLGLLAASGAALAGGLTPLRELQALTTCDAATRERWHRVRGDVATPQQALAALAAGNQRFVAGTPTAPNRDAARLRAVAPAQTPFAAVLACADSRVPVELLFDQGFGDIFVCRAAGNIVTPELLASLEFGTLVLGAKALVVLGHTSCGAVKATMAGDAVPGQISTLYQHIQPAVDRAPGKGVDEVAAENVRVQMALLRTASPVIRQLVQEGKLAVAGGMADLATGRVAMLTA